MVVCACLQWEPTAGQLGALLPGSSATGVVVDRQPGSVLDGAGLRQVVAAGPWGQRVPWLLPRFGREGQSGPPATQARALLPEVGSTEGASRHMPSPGEWAALNFGGVALGDRRRNERAVVMAEGMARFPGATLPQQLGGLAGLKAGYRLLGREEVTLAALSARHWELTRQAAAAPPLVLFVMDFTTLALSAYAKSMKELGRVGSGNKGWGMMVHTTLAVLPGSERVLGVAYQQMIERLPLPEGMDYRQRPKEERISRAWGEALGAIGPARAGARWMVVADREADYIDFLLDCRRLGYEFCIRVSWDRRLVDETGQGGASEENKDTLHLLKRARSWASVAEKCVDVPARKGQKAREAKLHISYGEAELRVPKGEAPLHVWVVRAWEVDAPAGVKEPLEWVLFTTTPVRSAQEALALLDLYTCRWVVEDYHQCLKTGCNVEHRDLEHVDRLERLLGFAGPLAARLLQLRGQARLDPEVPATAVADELTVRVLARELGVPAEGMKVYAFWRNVARLGGFLGRKRDGEPGWKLLWRGWRRLDELVRGARHGQALLQAARWPAP